MRQKHPEIMPGFFHGDNLNDENETNTLQNVRRFREESKRVDAASRRGQCDFLPQCADDGAAGNGAVITGIKRRKTGDRKHHSR